ncbi:MAG: hypothetical protein JWN40_5776 [Phycisphaerales bacterium]|nr:hypothetical protein [Phycisphaerales bacterium]
MRLGEVDQVFFDDTRLVLRVVVGVEKRSEDRMEAPDLPVQRRGMAGEEDAPVVLEHEDALEARECPAEGILYRLE